MYVRNAAIASPQERLDSRDKVRGSACTYASTRPPALAGPIGPNLATSLPELHGCGCPVEDASLAQPAALPSTETKKGTSPSHQAPGQMQVPPSSRSASLRPLINTSEHRARHLPPLLPHSSSPNASSFFLLHHLPSLLSILLVHIQLPPSSSAFLIAFVFLLPSRYHRRPARVIHTSP